VIVDHQGIIINYKLGWPASVNDLTMFKESEIWQHRGEHFTDAEYLLVDKG
jgi:hypothetical protein